MRKKQECEDRTSAAILYWTHLCAVKLFRSFTKNYNDSLTVYAETNECIHSIYTYKVGQECAQRPVKFFPYSVTSDLLTSGPIPALISFCALLSVVCNASPTGIMWHLLRIVEPFVVSATNYHKTVQQRRFFWLWQMPLNFYLNCLMKYELLTLNISWW